MVESSSTRRVPFTYIAISRIECETATTGKPVCRLTRSAVRWRVPVSSVGMLASGIRWTPARRILVMSLSRITAPSSLHSSRSRVAVNSTSSTKPPVHRASTLLSKPRTIRPPVLARSTRSNPSRSAVPGATALREARSRASSRVDLSARSMAAT